jgi:hypothetical protein
MAERTSHILSFPAGYVRGYLRDIVGDVFGISPGISWGLFGYISKIYPGYLQEIKSWHGFVEKMSKATNIK